MVGDPLGKVWLPYLGFRGRSCKKSCSLWDPEYRWRVIASPWAGSKYTNPLGIHCHSPVTPPPIVETTTTLYRLNGNNGRFIEGEAEVMGALTPGTRLGFWVMGSSVELEGTGHITSTVDRSDNFVAVSGTADATDSRYFRTRFGFGLLAGVLF